MAESSAKNIVLIGYRGCGKTTVGRLLAERLGRPFVDTDELVAADAGRTIADIFATQGEAGFRQREAEVIARVAGQDGQVIAVGGGAVLDSRNVQRLSQTGTIVWLTAPAEVLWQRISADQRSAASRPDLTAVGGLNEVRELLTRREPAYRDAADAIIDTTTGSPRDQSAAIDQVARKK